MLLQALTCSSPWLHLLACACAAHQAAAAQAHAQIDRQAGAFEWAGQDTNQLVVAATDVQAGMQSTSLSGESVWGKLRETETSLLRWTTASVMPRVQPGAVGMV